MVYPIDVRYVGASHWLQGDTMTRRHSSVYALEYITAGACAVRIGRKTHTYGPGDIFILHPDESHVYRATGLQPLVKYFCALHVDTLLKRTVLQSLGLLACHALHVPAGARAEIEAAFQRLLATARMDHATRHTDLCAQAYDMLLRVSKLVQAPAAALPYPAPMARALQFVHDTGLQVHVSDMARAAGVSVEHLNRLFSAHLGRRTHEWLLRLRMAIAAQLLSTTRMKVYEIAGELGYETPYSFCRAFMRMNKMTPMQCRRRSWRRHGVAG